MVGPEGRRWLAAVVGLWIVTAIVTFPAGVDLCNRLVGDGWDGRMFLRHLWRTSDLVAEGHWPLWDSKLCHPEGVSLAQQPPCLPVGLVAAPLVWTVGPVAAYNLVMLAMAPLAGLAAILLLRRLEFDWSVAAVAGALFAFGTIRMGTTVFLNLAQGFWLPLVVVAVGGAVRSASIRSAAAAGCALGGVVASSYVLALIAAILTVLVVCAGAFGPVVRERASRRFLVVVGCAALVACPVLVALARDLVREGGIVTQPIGCYGERTDLTLFLAQWRWGSPGPDGAPVSPDRAAFVGSVALVLGVLGAGLGLRERKIRAWTVAAGLLFLVSLGPSLCVAGVDLAVPLPWELLSRCPVVREVRVAVRFAQGFWLCWIVLVAHGLRAVVDVVGRRWSGAVVALPIGVALLGVVEHLQLPFPLVSPLPDVPSVIDVIGSAPGDGAVFEIMGGRFGYSGFSCFQMRHGRPVLEGQLSRIPPSVRRNQDSSPLLRAFRRVVAGQALVPPLGSSGARAIAAEARRLRVRWVMIPLVRDPSFTPAGPELLTRLDRMVRDCLPVRSVLYSMSASDEREQRARLARSWDPGRLGADCLWRVYELELPERP